MIRYKGQLVTWMLPYLSIQHQKGFENDYYSTLFSPFIERPKIIDSNYIPLPTVTRSYIEPPTDELMETIPTLPYPFRERPSSRMLRYKNHSISGINHPIHESTTAVNLKAKRRHSLGNGEMDRLMASNRNQRLVKPEIDNWLTLSCRQPGLNSLVFMIDEENSSDFLLQVLPPLSPKISPKDSPDTDVDHLSNTPVTR
ncbi:hypothetical protein K501DRAFT_270257 [Backusella circina FSU 941]|nr:hypothetical protein K501DRAFT_270257 [Backusella circina FSU 941]